MSAVGGAQEEIDFTVEQCLRGERAGVQVKSSATGALIRACAAKLEARGYDLVIIACHTLQAGRRGCQKGVLLLDRAALARLACAGGLAHWLMAKSRGAGPRR